MQPRGLFIDQTDLPVGAHLSAYGFARQERGDRDCQRRQRGSVFRLVGGEADTPDNREQLRHAGPVDVKLHLARCTRASAKWRIHMHSCSAFQLVSV